MILSSHGIIGSSIVQIVYDADAQAFFDRVTTAGGSLSLTEKSAVNQLVLDMKDDAIWSKMKAIYPMVGASAAACAQNLKSSSFTGTFTATGWTFASTGVTPNGTSAFMNTGLIASNTLSETSNHICVYIRTDANALMYDIGANFPGLTADISIVSRFDNQFFLSNGIQAYKGIINTSSLGFYLNSRTSSTVIKGYKNNNLLINTTNATGLPTVPFYIGAVRQSDVSGVNFSNKENAFASIGDGLTDTEASDFYTAVQAFQTTLNRQV